MSLRRGNDHEGPRAGRRRVRRVVYFATCVSQRVRTIRCSDVLERRCGKSAIIDFVGRVTKEGGSNFVPVPVRIAGFDNDGMLWTEQP
jgi:hypothetical protein